MDEGLKRVIKRLLRLPADALIASSTKLPALIQGQIANHEASTPDIREVLQTVSSISARFWPLREGEIAWMIPKPTMPPEVDPQDKLPVPGNELWAGYNSTPQEYISSGLDHYFRMLEVLQAAGFILEADGRVLDFGCAAGRMIRCLKEHAQNAEVWGVDQSARHIVWCQQYLSPPFRFVTSTTFPHLPFEDNYFDLVYAGSVFTHIGDLEDAWLMELRRIVRPGGWLYITVSDNRTIDILLSSPPGHWLHDSPIRQQLLDFERSNGFLESGFDLFLTSRAPGNSQVFHDRDYIHRVWGRYFEIASISPEAYGYQTAITLRK